QYCNKPPSPVKLGDLLKFGKPPLSTEALLRSAQYAHSELPVRLARRVQAFQKLPFIVGTNPYIKGVHQMYYDSFEKLRNFPTPVDTETDANYTESLTELTRQFADTIPRLAQGFMECKKYMKSEDIAKFFDDLIRSRIGIRLIAEQHVALHSASGSYIGIIDTQLKPSNLLRHCAEYVQELCEMTYGSAPQFIINGQTDTMFTYIPVHLEYVACELLKNAYRATVEFSRKSNRINYPPVEITITCGEEHVGVRIRDQGGGIPPEHQDGIFQYSYTTVKHEEDEENSIFSVQTQLAMQSGVGGPIAGLGFGLPMALVYSKYFGGDLIVRSLTGYGCDVFLSLQNIGNTAAGTMQI
ncbi:alpha-ketoacid dehydrogenase kinase, partial [Basidiobolus meristosporus CBS 931.73]